MQPVRTAFLYESKHRVNIMKRMAAHGVHNHLGRKRGQVYLWEKLIRGDEVLVGQFLETLLVARKMILSVRRCTILPIHSSCQSGEQTLL